MILISLDYGNMVRHVDWMQENIPKNTVTRLQHIISNYNADQTDSLLGNHPLYSYVMHDHTYAAL